jgi:hypothetical protein
LQELAAIFTATGLFLSPPFPLATALYFLLYGRISERFFFAEVVTFRFN